MDKQIQAQKIKIIEIIKNFEIYYLHHHLSWNMKELSSSHQILGTLILTFKKLESLEKSLDLFKENDLMETFDLEFKEVTIISEYYYDTFVLKI